MSRKARALLAAAFSVIIMCAAAGTAAAASSVIVASGDAGAFTASTTSRQTLRTTVSGIIPASITCSQSAAFTLNAGTYSAANSVFGSVTNVTFTCDPIALGTPVVTALALPWQLVGSPAVFNATTGLVRIRGVRIQVSGIGVTCLFGNTTSEIGIGVTNGSTIGTLLGGSLPSNSSACSVGSVSTSGYTFSRPIRYSIS